MSGPFVILPTAIAASPLLTAAAKSVLLALENFKNHRTGQCNPKHATLAAAAGGLSISTVQRALNKLGNLGLIRVTRGRYFNRYQIAPRDHWCKYLEIGQNDRSGTAQIIQNDRSQIGQNDRSAPAVSLFSEPDLVELYTPSVVVGVRNTRTRTRGPSEHPAATTAVPLPHLQNGNGNGREREIRETARALVTELQREHPQPGETNKARTAAETVLRASSDLPATIATIRESHAAWLDYWDELPGGSFIPYLDLWFTRAYHEGPPSEAAFAALKKPPGKTKQERRDAEVLRILRESKQLRSRTN